MKFESNGKIFTYLPLNETRLFTPDRRFYPHVLQRKFLCKNSHGATCKMWIAVEPNNSLIPTGVGKQIVSEQ